MKYAIYSMPNGKLEINNHNFVGIEPTIDDAMSVARSYSASENGCKVAIVDRVTNQMIDWGTCSSL